MTKFKYNNVHRWKTDRNKFTCDVSESILLCAFNQWKDWLTPYISLGPKNGTQNEHILSTQKKGKQKANNTSDIINRYTAYSLKPFIVVASLRLPFRIELTNDNLFNIHLSLSLSLSFRIGPLCTAIANEDCVLCMTK